MVLYNKDSGGDKLPACDCVGEEILNSLTVIRGIAQLIIKGKYPAEWLLVDREITKICLLVRNYFGLQLRG